MWRMSWSQAEFFSAMPSLHPPFCFSLLAKEKKVWNNSLGKCVLSPGGRNLGSLVGSAKEIMMRTPAIFIVIASIAATNIFAVAYAADYEIDAERSELVVRLFKGGVAAAIAHNHVIRAVEYAGGAEFDQRDPEAASIWVEAQTASLKADEPETRERFGLPKGISEKDRRKIQATMLSAKQMDVEEYPTLKFRSTNVEEQSDGRYQITGDLTIHGETRSIKFPITVEAENGDLYGSVTIDFKQSDFGIEPYSAMFGAVRNRDDAVLYAKIVLVLGSADEKETDQVIPDASYE